MRQGGETGAIVNAMTIAADACERLAVLGDQQTIRVAGEHTGGAYTLIEQCNAPGVGVPLHVHDREDEAFHVLEGVLELTIAGRTVVARAGDTVLAPRGVPHAIRFSGAPQTRVLLIVTPAGIESMFRELAALLPGPPDMARVTEICGRHGVRFV